MDKPYTRSAEPVQFSRNPIHVEPSCWRQQNGSSGVEARVGTPTKPYSANWRERRQKARVIAQAYKRRKPEPDLIYWPESPF